MSVNVTIPVAADFREAVVTELDGIGEMVLVGGNLITLSARSILKIDKNDFSVRTVLQFANDGKHDNPIDLAYSLTKDRVYVTFQNNGRVVISEVNLSGSMSSVDVVDTTASIVASNAPKTIATESSYVVVGLKGLAGASQILRFETAVWGRIDMDLTTPHYIGVTDLCVAAGKIFFVAWVGEPEKLLIRANLATAVIESASAPFSAGGDLRFAHILPLGSEVWFSFEDINGKVWRASQSTLVVTEIPTGIGGDHAGLDTDGRFVWQILLPTSPPELVSRAARINPLNQTDIRFYALSSGEGYIVQLVGDGTYLYTIKSTGEVARYRILADGTLLSLSTGLAAGGSRITLFACATDSLDNTVAIGALRGSGTFETTRSSVSGSFDVLLIKYLPDGTPLWSQNIGALFDDYGYVIALDDSNNIYIGGSFYGTVDFGGGQSLTAATGAGGFPVPDAFVAKYSPAGVLQWVTQWGGSGGEACRAMAIFGDTLLVCGSVDSSFTFGGVELNKTSNNDFLVAQLDCDTGAPIWVKGFIRTVSAAIGTLSIAADSLGNPVVAGTFSSTLNLGGATKTSNGGNDLFVGKLSAANGSELWTVSYGGTGNDSCKAIALDSLDNIYITGHYTTSIGFGAFILSPGGTYIASLDSSGSPRWAMTPNFNRQDATDTGSAITTQGQFVFIVGQSISPMYFPGPEVVLSGGSNFWVAAFITSGTARWAKRGGGTGGNFATGVSAGGHLSVIGGFDNTCIFEPERSVSAATAATDMFLLGYAL